MGPSGKVGGGSQAYIRRDKATQPQPRPAAKSWLAERFKQGPISVTIPREVHTSGYHHLLDRKVRALQVVSKVVSKLNKVPPLTLPGWGDRSDNKQSVDTKITCSVSDIDLGEFECLSIDGANGQGSEEDDWCIVENSQRQAVGTESTANQTTPKIIVLPENCGGGSEAAIFMRGEPVFSDIRQNVRRKTCYLNASLAAYLANKDSLEVTVQHPHIILAFSHFSTILLYTFFLMQNQHESRAPENSIE